MLDLEPATSALARVVAGVRDDQLSAPTPCADASVATLLDHVDGLALAFTAAARKAPIDAPPLADGSRLAGDWRSRIAERLATLADAWRDPSAWTGMTAGGVDLPGDVAGMVALDEVIVHSWDIASATGQHVSHDPALIEGAAGFVRPTVESSPDGVPGLFGPAVPVADDAPPLHQLLGMTGRDPAWRAVAASPQR